MVLRPSSVSPIAACASLTRAISRTRTVDEIYETALDALAFALDVERASILLFDADGVMRFAASRGLSETYRRAVEGHTPWRPDSPNPRPIVVSDVETDSTMADFAPAFRAEGIRALAFIPLVSLERVIGKFMLYYAEPTELGAEELELIDVIAAQVAFAVERTRTELQALRNEERLRFALEAASMGTWDWDLRSNEVQWSDNLAPLHGLPPDAFDGTFASYEREIHPEDRPRVFASVQRALADAVPHDVEYRIVAPDGTVRWCEGKGRVEYEDGQPTRMTGVCMLVTRRKEAELAKIEAAEEASRLKDEFLAVLSHELRSPLNAILGWVQMLESGELPPARTQLAIEVIGRNARLQAHLIEDILDVSRIITGKLDIEPVPVSVPQVVDTAVNAVAPAAVAKGVALETTIAAALPAVHGDVRRLHQVLNNVLTNAVKFTPAGGAIQVHCEADDRHVRIEVRDTGEGIDPEFLPLVFERFRQADSRLTRAHDGLGLGLAIAKHLVEAHGGQIRASSRGRGLGTTVEIRLPIADTGGSAPTTAASAGSADQELAGLTVLVVDDQADSRKMVGSFLEHRGAEVLQCESAEAAIEAIARRTVDVLVADIAMPDVDGYTLVRSARQSGFTAPAIAISAFARADDRRRALDAGFTGFLVKPLDCGELSRMLRDVLGSGPRRSSVEEADTATRE